MKLFEFLIYIQESYAKSLALLSEVSGEEQLIHGLIEVHETFDIGDEIFEDIDDLPEAKEDDDFYSSVEASLARLELTEELEDFVISFPPYRCIAESSSFPGGEIPKELLPRYQRSLEQFCLKWFNLMGTVLRLPEPTDRLWKTPWRIDSE